MARLKTTGFDEYIAKLEKITTSAHGQIKMAIWEGARVAAKALSQGMQSIPVQDEFVPKNHIRTGITQAEKNAIVKHFGIAKMKDSGSATDTHVGWKRGAFKRGDTYVPIVTLVRQIESGTSWLRKSPFARKAINSCRASAESAMRERFETELNKITGGI